MKKLLIYVYIRGQKKKRLIIKEVIEKLSCELQQNKVVDQNLKIE